jgi:DNA recombination protein RmuC
MDITIILTILVIVLILILGFVVFLLSQKGGAGQEFGILQKNMEVSTNHLFEMIRSMESKVLGGEREMKRTVENQNDKMFAQFENANKLIREITQQITEVKEGNKQVLGMTEQLSNLEKVLTNQKQRGNWGESSLDLILSNFLPDNYQMQYQFKNGEIVDAVINVKDKLLPIDSKFSLDNYERCISAENEDDKKYYGEEFKKDLKLRIAETAKYVRENENTLPLAFMFIPSEAIYYDLLAGEQSRLKVNTQALMEYAQKNKVFIVSPTSILAYLHLVISGIKAFNIEENAKQIQKKVEDLGRHIASYEDYYKKLGTAITTTVNHYNKGYDELKKIDKDVYKITDGVAGGGVETLKLDRPQQDE